jgi:hypothetical protein
MVLLCLSFSPLSFGSDCGSGRGKEPSGGKVLRLIQIRLARPSLEIISLLVKKIRRKRESQIQVPETQSAFHPLAQQNAFRRYSAS